MHNSRQRIVLSAFASMFCTWVVADTAPAARVIVDQDAAVHLPAVVIPFSDLASPEAKSAFLQSAKQASEAPKPRNIAEQRQMLVAHFQSALRYTKGLYPVDSVATTIAGIYTDVITPKAGIAPRNKSRVLINLHGGGFVEGARIIGALESIPIAGLGKIKVITVDYRQGPEYKFPAASEDATAVYKELLKSYKPHDIGIYGCSAGGVLTAQVAAWIGKENLPMPGAIGVFCASAAGWSGGDSRFLAPQLMGETPSPEDDAPPHPSVNNALYFSNADFNDPMVEPIHSNAVLAKFPPTLIITSTRDIALSSAVYTHTQLVRLGVKAELHVWEGMIHGFFTIQPELPESKDAWMVITKFFDKHLGTE